MTATPEAHTTHGELLESLAAEHAGGLSAHPVLVETGCGVSTVSMNRIGARLGAVVFSCDTNREKVERLRELAGPDVAGVRFLVGDGAAAVGVIAAEFGRIDLLFLDSAASAMHTFREFQAAEPALGPGSIVVVDNAALPGAAREGTPVRKGKILVPYLMASAWWAVTAHPHAGDSMVSAIRHATPDHADPDFEWPDFEERWERRLPKLLGDL